MECEKCTAAAMWKIQKPARNGGTTHYACDKHLTHIVMLIEKPVNGMARGSTIVTKMESSKGITT